jgi:hypothetical protein
MAHRQCSEDYIVQMLDECDSSDLENVLSKSDDKFIPQGDASELEDNLEVNSEESDTAGQCLMWIPMKMMSSLQNQEECGDVSCPRLLAVATVTLSQDLPGQRAQLMLQP